MNHSSLPFKAGQVSFGPTTLLIVDDEALNRKLLTEIFKDEGDYVLLQASNGKAAIRLAIDERPDMILLDILMPEMDGYAVCTALKNNPHTASIPIILVTALNSSADESKGLDCGAIDYIHKPVNPTILRARVKAHIEGKQSRDYIANTNSKLKLVNSLLEKEILDRLKIEQDLLSARDEIAHANRVKEGVIKDLFQAMCEMLSSRDFYTFEHGMRVASISRLIGDELGLDSAELENLELGCMLHDISKVAIPDDVLLKPGVFDAQDRKIMHLHPAMGARLFSRQSCDPRIIDVIHHHHERLDGSGYPEGLTGDAIRLPVRIAMVADIYEAMVAKRPYKKSMSRSEALGLMQQEVDDGLIDQAVVDALRKVTEDWNPFDQILPSSDRDTRALEIFRKKTYFKEPLSDFYNYRYLFFLEKSGLLDCADHGYALFCVEVTNLEQINREQGYLKADQILDEVGTKLHEVLFSQEHLDELTCLLILMRKGTTYLVYTNCPEHELTKIDCLIQKSVQCLQARAGVVVRKNYQKFMPDIPVEVALYEVLSSRR